MKQVYTDPFQAIADLNRREILHLLSKEKLSVNSLALNFDMSRPAVSRHIKILFSAGFIVIEDKGRERICALKKEGFKELQSWLAFYDKFWNSKLDALELFLSKTSPKSTSKKSKSWTQHNLTPLKKSTMLPCQESGKLLPTKTK